MKHRSREELETRYARARELWDSGKPMREIAMCLGMSVSSACGVTSRMRKLKGWFPKRRATQAQVRPPTKKLASISLRPGTPLHAAHKGTVFNARITDGNEVLVDEIGRFKSFSAAAMGAVEAKSGLQRQINGLDFWRVTLRDGRSCNINRLRERPELLDQVAETSEDAQTLPPRKTQGRGTRLAQVEQLLTASASVPEISASLEISEPAVHAAIQRLRGMNPEVPSCRRARLRQLLKTRSRLVAKLGEIEQLIQNHMCVCGRSFI